MSDYTIEVSVDASCQISSEKIEVFARILKELLPFVLPSDIEYLKEFLVVPDNELERTVNTLLQGQAKAPGLYHEGITPPSAVAVPVENDSGLRCFIIVGEDLLQSINLEEESADIVSTLLEELLHVRLYAATWQRRGYLIPRTAASRCTRDLFLMCSNFHDEYVVSRWKASIFASLGGEVWYGLSLAPILDLAPERLTQIAVKSSTKSSHNGDTWGELTRSIYRGIFEPLARDAGFRSGNSKSPPIPNSASESRFYRDHVARYWMQILVQLERSFDSELAEAGSALDEISKSVRKFLTHMGIAYHGTVDGQCRVSLRKSGMVHRLGERPSCSRGITIPRIVK